MSTPSSSSSLLSAAVASTTAPTITTASTLPITSTKPTLSLPSTSSSSVSSLTSIPIKLEQHNITFRPAPISSDRSLSPKTMSSPTSLSEWQLLAVLQRANLVQYFDTFISKGGDDINQIMQCDEQEFLEIMSLVGMLPKPLHVRRLQKALTEYSQDQTAFNLAAIQQIGPPPPSLYSINGTDPMALLLPGVFNSLSSNSSSDTVDTSSASPSLTSSGATTSNSVSLAVELSSTLLDPSAADQQQQHQPRINTSIVAAQSTTTATTSTSNAVSQSNDGNRATNVGFNFGTTTRTQQQQQSIKPGLLSTNTIRSASNTSSQEKEGSSSPFVVPFNNDFVSLGDFDPNFPTNENPTLSTAQINRLAECALAASKCLPPLPPRLIQNKKRVSKEVLELMQTTPKTPNHVQLFRKFSAIYGRFDTKRKPHKVLTLHETAVNEAAAQLCLLVPSLLTRRDELFPLARQIVKDAGYHYAKTRKRPCDPADLHSPISSPSTSPPPGLAEQGFENERNEQPDEITSSTSSGGNNSAENTMVKEEASSEMTSGGVSSILEQWASGLFAQPKREKSHHS